MWDSHAYCDSNGYAYTDANSYPHSYGYADRGNAYAYADVYAQQLPHSDRLCR